MTEPYVPEPGDLVWLSFDPQVGHEQDGRRPALVITRNSYNRRSGLAVVCPVTRTAKGYPFEVTLPEGSPVKGWCWPTTSGAWTRKSDGPSRTDR